MRVLSRYILKEFLSNAILGLIIFTFVLMLDHLFEIVDLLINKGVGLGLTGQLLFYLLPSSFTLTLPVSILLACLLTYGRLSENNEITAVRASGLAAWSYVKMPIISAIMVTLFLIPFNTKWAPHAHASFRKLYVQVLKKNPLVRIEEKTFVEIGEYRLYVERKEKNSKMMRGVTIYKMPSGSENLRIFAQKGSASYQENRGITLLLNNGRIEQLDAADPTRWINTEFRDYQFFIPLEGSKSISEREIEEMDNKELRAEIKSLQRNGSSHLAQSCHLHLRWALAITPVLFAALGIPLAIRLHRGGRSIGFGLSLLIMVIYYVMIMGGMGIGQRGTWPPWLAVWLANVVLLVASAGIYRRMTRL